MASIERIVVGPEKQNCYILHDSSGDAIVIDPGSEGERVCGLIDSLDVKPSSIINTHGHFDHIGGVDLVGKKYGIPFALHGGDRKLLRRANLYAKMSYPEASSIEVPKFDLDLSQKLQINSSLVKSLEVKHLPGHTPGSVCLFYEDFVLSGDIVFRNSIGRTDLPGGDPKSMNSSVQWLIDNAKGKRFFPGHGNSFLLSDVVIAKWLKGMSKL